jgi:hypothetical protein
MFSCETELESDVPDVSRFAFTYVGGFYYWPGLKSPPYLRNLKESIMRSCSREGSTNAISDIVAIRMPSFLQLSLLVFSKGYTGDKVKRIYKYENRFHLLCKIMLFLGNEYGYLGSRTSIRISTFRGHSISCIQLFIWFPSFLWAHCSRLGKVRRKGD